MNQNVNHDTNQPQNHNQGPIVRKISLEPRTQLAYIGVITQGGAKMGDDDTLPQIRLVAQKKVQFDVDTEKEMFFDARDVIKRDTGKLNIHEMPSACDLTLV